MTRSRELLERAKPILFNTDMVRAIQDGNKSATRRVIKPQPKYSESGGFAWKGREYGTDLPPTIQGAACNFLVASPYQIGDILYVRETWNTKGGIVTPKSYIYKADDENGYWKPSIHMPKEAARIFLRVTDVRVERLQDITEEQAVAEGVRIGLGTAPYFSCKDAFSGLWDSTIKKSDLTKYGWNANPWVFVFEFERLEVSE